jgi:hypothetical protein
MKTADQNLVSLKMIDWLLYGKQLLIRCFLWEQFY